jgi:hypothetical protein
MPRSAHRVAAWWLRAFVCLHRLLVAVRPTGLGGADEVVEVAPDLAHRHGGLGNLGVQDAGRFEAVEARRELHGTAEVGTIGKGCRVDQALLDLRGEVRWLIQAQVLGMRLWYVWRGENCGGVS